MLASSHSPQPTAAPSRFHANQLLFASADTGTGTSAHALAILVITAKGVTVRAKNRGKATLDGENYRAAIIINKGAEYVDGGDAIIKAQEATASPPTVVLEGLDITKCDQYCSEVPSYNCDNVAGVSIQVWNKATVTINFCDIHDASNTGTPAYKMAGGAIGVSSGLCTTTDLAPVCTPTLEDVASVVNINSCNFYNNAAGDGGAIIIASSIATITDTKIYDNVASGSGGGIIVDAGPIGAILTFESSQMYSNSVSDSVYGKAGGIMIGPAATLDSPGVTLIVRNSLFYDNTAKDGGCAIHVDTKNNAADSELFNNTFSEGSGICQSAVMLSVMTAVPWRCAQLGEWMTPAPYASGLDTFTGCRYKCDPGTYGASYDLSTAACTAPCTIGHFCAGGDPAPVPCPLNTFMPDEGASVCTACPAFATTNAEGSTSIHDCECTVGRYLDISTATCTQCQTIIPDSTTSLPGAISSDECECNLGFYSELVNETKSCVPCDPVLMDCSIVGVTLANMPIKPGGWRLSNTTSIVHECFNPDVCVGNPGVAGSNATQRRRLSAGASTSTAGDALCAPGHSGFLCGTCVAGWCGAPHAPHAPSPCHFLRARGSTWFTSHMTRTRAEMST